nr:MAG TPA: hypothetical protein [Caudoviricetes sp.]
MTQYSTRWSVRIPTAEYQDISRGGREHEPRVRSSVSCLSRKNYKPVGRRKRYPESTCLSAGVFLCPLTCGAHATRWQTSFKGCNRQSFMVTAGSH